MVKAVAAKTAKSEITENTGDHRSLIPPRPRPDLCSAPRHTSRHAAADPPRNSLLRGPNWSSVARLLCESRADVAQQCLRLLLLLTPEVEEP